MSGRVLSKHFRKSNIMNKGGLFVQHFISLLYHWVLFSIVCFVSLTLGRLVIQKPTSPPSDNAAGKATLKVADPSISHGRVRVGIMIRKRRHPPQLSAFYKKEMHLQISLERAGLAPFPLPWFGPGWRARGRIPQLSDEKLSVFFLPLKYVDQFPYG